VKEYERKKEDQSKEKLSANSTRTKPPNWPIVGLQASSICRLPGASVVSERPLYKVVEETKLDYELLDAGCIFLAKPPKFYPFLEKWQAMIKRGAPR